MSRILRPDLLVVGLGPAGASAARRAALAGLNVMAVERKSIAGIPVQCAEFVPTMLAPTIDAVHATERQRITQMHTVVEGGQPDREKNFPGAMIDRAKFDQQLVTHAKEAGADCRFGCAVVRMSPEGDVHLSSGERVVPRVVIGADGPRSKVGRAVGIVNQQLVVTQQITVPLLQCHEATDIFLSAEYYGGYAWLFPSGEVANLGLGLDPSYRAHLRPLLRELHDRMCSIGRLGKHVMTKTGGAIPVGGMLSPSARRGEKLVLLCGDAAGLTNPVTGAGISAAVMSGALAGEAAGAWCAGEAAAESEYCEELADLFGAALERAVRRRVELLEKFKQRVRPKPADLRNAWIAYPQYWAA